MLAPRVGRSPTFHRRNAVCRHESPNRQPRQGNRSKKAPRKVHASLPSPPEPIHVIASFRPYVLHGMRVARYAPRKQKPAERTRCIYSSGSPHCSLFRPVQPIPLRLAPSPFHFESTPPTSSSSSFCPPPPPFPSLFPTRSPPFAIAILPSLLSFILLQPPGPSYFFLFFHSFSFVRSKHSFYLRFSLSFLFLSLLWQFLSSLEQTCFPPSFAARRESAASKIDNRANDGQASNFH